MTAREAAALWPDDPEAVREWCKEIDWKEVIYHTDIDRVVSRVARVALELPEYDAPIVNWKLGSPRSAFLRFMAGEGER